MYKVVVVVVVIVGVVNLLFLEIISAVDQLGKTEMKMSSTTKIIYSWQVNTFIELFAGVANTSRVMRLAGYSTAALDLSYYKAQPGKHNFMDIMTPSGMACGSYLNV